MKQLVNNYYNQSLVPAPVISYPSVSVDATTNATTGCMEWYFTLSGDSCDDICQSFDIPYWAFQEWNPVLGSACNLWADTSYCVYGPNGDEVYYGEAPTATSTGGFPGPTQTGIVAGCTEWYLAQAGDECSLIAGNYSISLAEFYAWNPAVGSSRQYLVPGDAYGAATRGHYQRARRPRLRRRASRHHLPQVPSRQCECRISRLLVLL